MVHVYGSVDLSCLPHLAPDSWTGQRGDGLAPWPFNEREQPGKQLRHGALTVFAVTNKLGMAHIQQRHDALVQAVGVHITPLTPACRRLPFYELPNNVPHLPPPGWAPHPDSEYANDYGYIILNAQEHDTAPEQGPPDMPATPRAPKRLRTLLRLPAPALPPLNPALAASSGGLELRQWVSKAFAEPPWPLRFAPTCGLYTDGSSIQDDSTGDTRTGAAVFNAKNDNVTLVNPNGLGPTNTITRAELAAINAALTSDSGDETSPLHIFTDSQASMQLIKKARDFPRLLSESKHAPLLFNIVNRLGRMVMPNKRPICFHKVKSHIGIRGNERADFAAKEAADGKQCHYIETSDNEPYNKIHWLAVGDRMVNNLTAAVKRAVSDSTAVGYTNTSAVYAAQWLQAERDSKTTDNPTALHGKASNRMWTAADISFATIRQVLNYRYGQLYNNKLALRYGHPLLGRAAHKPRPQRGEPVSCALCDEQDSGSHMLCNCKHEVVQGMIINRHNAAVQQIAKTIHKGSLGGCYTVMDAGAQDALPPYASSTRLPPWLLQDIEDSLRLKLRPDMLVVENLPTARLPADHRQARAGRRGTQVGSTVMTTAALRSLCSGEPTVHIIEVGYTADHLHPEKFLEKQAQHRQLADLLEAEGWKVKYHVFTLGVGGTVCVSLETNLMKHLGVERPAAEKCRDWLHKHATLQLHAMIKTRRELERKPP